MAYRHILEYNYEDGSKTRLTRIHAGASGRPTPASHVVAAKTFVWCA